MTTDELEMEIDNAIQRSIEARAQVKDNLFSANHRAAMIRKYGYTEAMTITVGELSGEV